LTTRCIGAAQARDDPVLLRIVALICAAIFAAPR
jgi:hypothetical protein